MNAFPPMISPRFQVSEDGKLQYKPYPAYPSWLDAWDVGALVPADVQAQIDAINLSIAALEANDAALSTLIGAVSVTADGAASSAAAALSDATQALSDAADAQSTADAALSAAAVAQSARRATMWMDEAHYVNGTPTLLVNSAYIGGFIRYTTTNLAEFTMSFVSGVLTDGGIYLLGTRGATSAIVEVRIDGTLVGTADLYNPVTQQNYVSPVGIGSGNPTFGAGYHKLSVKTNGRFVSSTGYDVALQKVYVRTNSD